MAVLAVREIGAAAFKAALAQVDGEGLAEAFEELLHQALGDVLVRGNGRHRQRRVAQVCIHVPAQPAHRGGLAAADVRRGRVTPRDHAGGDELGQRRLDRGDVVVAQSVEGVGQCSQRAREQAAQARAAAEVTQREGRLVGQPGLQAGARHRHHELPEMRVEIETGLSLCRADDDVTWCQRNGLLAVVQRGIAAQVQRQPDRIGLVAQALEGLRRRCDARHADTARRATSGQGGIEWLGRVRHLGPQAVQMKGLAPGMPPLPRRISVGRKLLHLHVGHFPVAGPGRARHVPHSRPEAVSTHL